MFVNLRHDTSMAAFNWVLQIFVCLRYMHACRGVFLVGRYACGAHVLVHVSSAEYEHCTLMYSYEYSKLYACSTKKVSVLFVMYTRDLALGSIFVAA